MKTLIISAALLAAGTLAAGAHATLETRATAVGSTYKAVVRIGHGCDGHATLKVRVRLPDGFYNAKPMPKADWTLETVAGAYDKPFDNHGTTITEGVREIVWTGNLPDGWYDEFVFRGTVGKDLAPGAVLYFPVVQECEGAAERWIEVPADGQPAGDLEAPAPGLTLTAPAAP